MISILLNKKVKALINDIIKLKVLSYLKKSRSVRLKSIISALNLFILYKYNLASKSLDKF